MQVYDVAAYHVRGLLLSLRQLGIDVDALLREAHIEPSAVDDPESRFSEPQVIQLWLGAERGWRGSAPLGLVAGAGIPWGGLELIDYLIAACGSVGEGITTLVRFATLCASGFRYQVERGESDDGEVVRVRLTHPYGLALLPPGILEYLWSVMIPRFQKYGDPRFRPRLCMQRAPRAPLAVYREVLGHVCFESEHEELEIPLAQWNLEHTRRDPMLSCLLARHASDVLERMPVSGDFPTSVRTAIADSLRIGDSSIERAAGRLGMTPRTLQRRLAESGHVYKQLVDEVRFELAGRYLTRTKLSLQEISDLLAYSEQRAFQRAFRRWSGLTPAAYRSRHETRERPERAPRALSN